MMRLTPMLALLITLPATAQDIPAQAAVGQCYSACATTIFTGQERVEVAIGRYDQLIYWNALTQAQGKELACGALQGLALEASICRASCRDVEAGYGSVNSQAENIFVNAGGGPDPLHTSGLFPNDRTHPRAGTPQFTAACNRLIGVSTDPLLQSIAKPPQQAENNDAAE